MQNSCRFKTAQICAGSNQSRVFAPNVLVNACYKNMHISTNQSQTTEVDQPSEGSLPLQPPLALNFSARSTGFRRMGLHIYFCAFIWCVCVSQTRFSCWTK